MICKQCVGALEHFREELKLSCPLGVWLPLHPRQSVSCIFPRPPFPELSIYSFQTPDQAAKQCLHPCQPVKPHPLPMILCIISFPRGAIALDTHSGYHVHCVMLCPQGRLSQSPGANHHTHPCVGLWCGGCPSLSL